ncbi:hypothetical protein G6715_05020 [Polynucleobacter paneuropaeus]|nr:hypothetical protein [Polynucleobacter paneuropaeus]
MNSNSAFRYLSGIFFGYMFLMAIAGIFLNFSYIPYGDMWNGTLGFFLKVQDGQYSEWWSFHNDHRIILARILFWVDYQFFGGLSIFLMISNAVLELLICYVYWLYLKKISEKNQYLKENSLVLWFLFAGCLFSWIQEENLTWAFQSQFFLAQLIPLLALYFLGEYTAKKNTKYFIFATLFGLLSAGTMANGILIFPLIFLYLIVTRQGIYKCIIAFLFSVLVPALYFQGYVRPAKDGFLFDVLLNNFPQIIHFSIVYLGGPFAYLGGFGSLRALSALFFGIMFVALFIGAIYRILKSKQADPYIISLIFFILYILATSIITGIGRLVVGIDSALASRYTTPVIMAWVALAIVIEAAIHTRSCKAKIVTFLILIFIIVPTIFYQINALKNNTQDLYQRKIGALALTLNVRDNFYIEKLFPIPDYALTISRFANSKNYSFFGISPYHEINNSADSYFFSAALDNCHESIRVDVTNLDLTGYARVEGMTLWENSENSNELIKFIDEGSGLISGFAFINNSGFAKNITKDAESLKYNKFTGYIKTSEKGRRIRAINSAFDCRAEFFLEPNLNPAFQLQQNLVRPTISYSDVTENIGFNGRDFRKTQKDGSTILGSHLNSDADKGHIIFRARPGDIFNYRSGPTKGHQIMKILNTDISILLPVTTDWVSIKFIGPQLPKKFDVMILDSGSDWGEWSAIELTELSKNN